VAVAGAAVLLTLRVGEEFPGRRFRDLLLAAISRLAIPGRCPPAQSRRAASLSESEPLSIILVLVILAVVFLLLLAVVALLLVALSVSLILDRLNRIALRALARHGRGGAAARLVSATGGQRQRKNSKQQDKKYDRRSAHRPNCSPKQPKREHVSSQGIRGDIKPEGARPRTLQVGADSP